VCKSYSADTETHKSASPAVGEENGLSDMTAGAAELLVNGARTADQQLPPPPAVAEEGGRRLARHHEQLSQGWMD
jgi:hypothetical protein